MVPYVLRCFPRDDPEFAGRANAALGAHRHGAVRHDGVAADLAETLRGMHPMVVVTESEVSTLVPGETVLYVYRDGSPLRK